jgi:hypothetical protein
VTIDQYNFVIILCTYIELFTKFYMVLIIHFFLVSQFLPILNSYFLLQIVIQYKYVILNYFLKQAFYLMIDYCAPCSFKFILYYFLSLGICFFVFDIFIFLPRILDIFCVISSSLFYLNLTFLYSLI